MFIRVEDSYEGIAGVPFINEGLLICFPLGLIGFHHINRYKLCPLKSSGEETGFWNLIAYKNDEDKTLGNLNFLMMELLPLKHPVAGRGQGIGVGELYHALSPLGVSINECAFFGIITVEEHEHKVSLTVNLKAPVVFHLPSKQGWQLILSGPSELLTWPLASMVQGKENNI